MTLKTRPRGKTFNLFRRLRQPGDGRRPQKVRLGVLNVGDLNDEGVDGHVSCVEGRVGPGILNRKQTHLWHLH